MFHVLRQTVNLILALIKWPLTAVFVVSIPDMVLAFFIYFKKYMVNPNDLMEFMVGILIFVVLYFLIIKKFNSYFKTLVHEFTHMIFCYLCFNYITDIRATFKSGGYVQPKYETNWLISISPYFVPSFSVFLMLLMGITGQRPEYSVYLLGFITAFQVISNYVQIHPGQTDFQHAGWIFTILFLLPSNLLMWGLILSFVDNGTIGMANFINLSFLSVKSFISNVI